MKEASYGSSASSIGSTSWQRPRKHVKAKLLVQFRCLPFSFHWSVNQSIYTGVIKHIPPQSIYKTQKSLHSIFLPNFLLSFLFYQQSIFNFQYLQTPRMSRHAATKLSSLFLQQLGPRLLLTTPTYTEISKIISRPAATNIGTWAKTPMLHVRNMTTLPTTPEEEKNQAQANSTSSINGQGEKAIVSYWGVNPPKLTKEDGSAWKWNCFRICIPSYPLRRLSFYIYFP